MQQYYQQFSVVTGCGLLLRTSSDRASLGIKDLYQTKLVSLLLPISQFSISKLLIWTTCCDTFKPSQFTVCSLFQQSAFPINIFTKHQFSTVVIPSSLSVPSPLYAVLCSSLSHTCLLYQTLCSLCSTALTLQFIWWPYVVPIQVDNLS